MGPVAPSIRAAVTRELPAGPGTRMIDAFLLLIDIISMLVLMCWSLAQDRADERNSDKPASSRQTAGHSARHR